ncbi:LysE family translocator [Tenacibaculum finnmarkense]|uniref:LysE family translocator n=1 Tax=Tenacibaculum finnmarkense TaxID=2781243 RepID=UPI001EFAD226|nr:LysE family transporter [Tenacibaculum finnmarkense]MCG8235989.1 LysE family transporter [Tenacibaculum finnmarkense genomovar ulcerans]MCG8794647.1 LysE family transporter [Tenacibaculum finnmarkense]MCG8796975.1 LysE family transporter [Tenacibaculum finnmarkense]MCG8830147.1 LysE family transporter [Tenacibaculum finnmarkense]
MDFYNFKNALFIGFIMSFMIGPVFFMLIKTSILKGARAAIAFNIGVILGDIAFMLIAYYGSRSLLEKIKDDPRLFMVGGLILIVYGFITYFDKNNKKDAQITDVKIIESTNYLKLLAKGFALNSINVGVLATWLGVILVVGPTLNMDPTAIFWYFTTILFGYATTDLGKILLAKQLKNKLTPLVIYRIKKGMGVLLIVFGVLIMLKSFVPKEEIDALFNKVTPEQTTKN